MSKFYYCENCETDIEDCECHTNYRALKKLEEQRRKKTKDERKEEVR